MLNIHETAEDFSLSDQHGEIQTLSVWTAKGPVLLYFYPADFTPGCTKEACAFRDMNEALKDAGVAILGVSGQAAGTHKKFAERYNLPFPLLADTDKKVAKAFGVTTLMGLLTRRVSFLIGKDMKIIERVVADFDVDKHVELARRSILQAA